MSSVIPYAQRIANLRQQKKELIFKDPTEEEEEIFKRLSKFRSSMPSLITKQNKYIPVTFNDIKVIQVGNEINSSTNYKSVVDVSESMYSANNEGTVSIDEIAIIDIPNTTLPYIKTLTNIMYRDIPTLAFEWIHVVENSGVLQPELVFRRIENIPIIANNKQFDYLTDEQFNIFFNRSDLTPFPLSDESISDIYSDNVARFTLDVEGPELAVNEKDYYIKSSELIFEPTLSQIERNIQVNIDPNFIITKLLPGQKLKINLYAILGKGKYHSKYVPVNTVIYEYDDSTMQKKIISDVQLELLNRKGGNQTIFDYDSITTPFSATYRIQVEATGQMSALDIIKQAISKANIYYSTKTLKDRQKDEEVRPYHYY